MKSMSFLIIDKNDIMNGRPAKVLNCVIINHEQYCK